MSAEQTQHHRIQIEISDKDIADAEKILLWGKKYFSAESKAFIKDFTTRDLCAVPGSGKTTTLHAKLLCLEKHLPFRDWSWICVLSHTNTAVDEIKNKIALHCPHLFSYPNFIGTIQDFVNTFFVKPYFNNNIQYWKIKVIDDDIFREQLLQEYGKIKRFKDQKGKTFWWILYRWYIEAKKKWYSEDEEVYIKNALFVAHPDYNSKKVVFWESIPWIGHRTLFNEEKFELWKTIRDNLFLKWCISYDLSYYFASNSFSELWVLRNIIRKRFPFVFVDEAQDMNDLQWELLEQIFWPNDWENIITKCYQRIWDPNQSIYDWSNKEGYKRELRNAHQLTKSLRFSHKIAKTVEQFSVLSKWEDYEIETSIIGWCDCEDYETCICIKPHLIIYDNPEDVLDKYIEIIKYHEEHSELSSEKYKYTAIGRIGKSPDNASHRFIGSYYSGYIRDRTKPKRNYNSCVEYLLYINRSKCWFAEIQKALLRSISKGIQLGWWPFLVTHELIERIKEISQLWEEEYYESYKEKMWSWSKRIYNNDIDTQLFDGIKRFVENYLSKTNVTLNDESRYKNFWKIISSQQWSTQETRSIKNDNNIYTKDWIDIYVQTIHSVKWETHEATLYMETYFDKWYDTNRLHKFREGNITDTVIKTAKMLYVWLSRPRKLLCFAIHKDNYNIVKWYLDSRFDSPLSNHFQTPS